VTLTRRSRGSSINTQRLVARVLPADEQTRTEGAVTKSRLDGDRLIVPRPDPAEAHGDPAAAPPDLAFLNRALYARPTYRRVVIGGRIAMMIGLPLLVAYLYATGGIEVDPAWVFAVVLICEIVCVAGFVWYWRREHR
jgi:hypothetical protein